MRGTPWVGARVRAAGLYGGVIGCPPCGRRHPGATAAAVGTPGCVLPRGWRWFLLAWAACTVTALVAGLVWAVTS
jgi:hypothetical protein